MDQIMKNSGNGQMLASVVRIEGERDSWWSDVVRLLSGHGVRRGDPEGHAVDTSIKAVKVALSESGKDTADATIGLAISHDGAGSKRAVTVLAFTNQGDKTS